MTAIKWSSSFELGIHEIDKQHWGLFALVHDLGVKLEQGSGGASVAATIDALVMYVHIHFEHEEKLMQSVSYSKYEDHKKLHCELARQVDELQNLFKLSPNTFDYESLMEFLSKWLIEHIVKADMDFADFFKSQSPSIEEVRRPVVLA